MSKTVVLLTAGTGSRMGRLASVINKTLLPIQDKAIISHIIEQFDENTRFVVALGYKKKMVETYLRLAHPNVNFSFVEVDNFDGPGSGPAYSLRCCKTQLPGPFFLVACDAYYEGLNDIPTDHNYICVSQIDQHDSPAYCNVELSGSKVVSILDKRYCTSRLAFNGAFYIRDVEKFWSSLGSLELSSGFEQLDLHAVQTGWTDLGTYERYTNYLRKFGFDFSKSDEFLWIVGDRVIKWFKDVSITADRVARAAIKPQLFPRIDFIDDGFYSYKFVPGTTLYNTIGPGRPLNELFIHLQTNVWPTTSQLQSSMCVDFYHTKTMERLQAFRNKHPKFNPRYINGTMMKMDIDTALNLIDWQKLCNENLSKRSGFIHGDLQFDNIIYDGSTFTLLDWRQNFAGEISVGDIYYDVAKLLGGIQINYAAVKRMHFKYSESDDSSVSFSCVHCPYHRELTDRIKRLFPDPIIDQITSLIYLNMAALHTEPFDKLLFCLALERFNAAA